MHNKKVLLQCCVLSTLTVALMITQDLIGMQPAWHWVTDAAAAVAMAFCWWGALAHHGTCAASN